MATRRKTPNSVVIYRGPSRIDGAPIVVVATGLAGKSANAKTGAMVQTWILRADMSPTEALRTGADSSICGGCIHRPASHDGTNWTGRSCYVNVAQAPLNVWKTATRGRYREATREELTSLFQGRNVRLGSYGDPAAVPLDVWDAVLLAAGGWTGYTHQARSPRLRDVLRYCQVSADSCEDATAARDAGVGSFRVLRAGEEAQPWEMVCPASEEAGKVTTCSDCRACSGWNGANVAIRSHGIGAKLYRAAPARALSLPVLNAARIVRSA